MPERDSAPPQYVKFTFLRVDPSWRSQDENAKTEARSEFFDVIRKFEDENIVRPYSTVGTRGDCDLLLWTIAPSIEEIQALHAAVHRSRLGRFLSIPHSFLSVTRRSQYVKAHARDDPSGHGSIRTVVPGSGRFLWVYPFWKTAQWYQLPLEARQEMMNEHFKIGHRFPGIRIHTTYAFGLDDPEFVLAFEGDDPSAFVDLVVALREARQRPYTLRDTPIFTAVRGDLQEILRQLG